MSFLIVELCDCNLNPKKWHKNDPTTIKRETMENFLSQFSVHAKSEYERTRPYVRNFLTLYSFDTYHVTKSIN